jgi:hypothetical protein
VQQGKWWLVPDSETEVNGDSRSTFDRGPSLVGSLGSSCQYKRILFVGPIKKNQHRGSYSSISAIHVHDEFSRTYLFKKTSGVFYKPDDSKNVNRIWRKTALIRI